MADCLASVVPQHAPSTGSGSPATTEPACSEAVPGEAEALSALSKLSKEAFDVVAHLLGDEATQGQRERFLSRAWKLRADGPEGTGSSATITTTISPAVLPVSPADVPTGLWLAANCGDSSKVAGLLAARADPNAVHEEVAEWGPLFFAAKSGHCEIIRMLLEQGARPDAADRKGETAIRQAAYWGHAEAVSLLSSEYVTRQLVVPELPCAVVLNNHAEILAQIGHRMGDMHSRVVICSTPEYGLNGETVMKDLEQLCTKLPWLIFGYDWGGSSTAEPADSDPDRVVPACCLSRNCTCGNERSATMVTGPVDWRDAKSVAGSAWWPKYTTKVMATLQKVAQDLTGNSDGGGGRGRAAGSGKKNSKGRGGRPKRRSYLQMLAVNGGQVSQLEQRTMPSIITSAVDDLRAKGLSISMLGSTEDTEAKVFLSTMDAADVFERLAFDCAWIGSNAVSHDHVLKKANMVKSPPRCGVPSAAAGDNLTAADVLQSFVRLENRRFFVLQRKHKVVPTLSYHDCDEPGTKLTAELQLWCTEVVRHAGALR